MTIEETVSALWGAIKDLDETIQNLNQLLRMQQGIEAGELEMHGPVPAVEGLSITIPDGPGEVTVETQTEVPAVEGMNKRTMELIALSKELGYTFLYHQGTLAVDNRVLDEFNRRSLPDVLEP